MWENYSAQPWRLLIDPLLCGLAALQLLRLWDRALWAAEIRAWVAARVVDEVDARVRKLLDYLGPEAGFIPAADLKEIMAAENRVDLLIGGFVDREDRVIKLWHGGLQRVTVPFRAFEKSGDGTEPDFNSFSVIDHGQTVKLGNYEAAADALLVGYGPHIRADFWDTPTPSRFWPWLDELLNCQFCLGHWLVAGCLLLLWFGGAPGLLAVLWLAGVALVRTAWKLLEEANP